MATIAENIQTLRSIKSDIKNAIIQKGGSVTDAFGTYAQAITNLPSGGGGGTEMEDALVMRTLSVYSNNRVSRVGNAAFVSCNNLKFINLQNCLSIGYNAFGNCVSLETVNLPLCEYIDGFAFTKCTHLREIYLNSVTSVTTLAYDNTFTKGPTFFSVYVPASLVDAFKTAQNWSSISGKIVAYTGASTGDIL